MSREQQTDTYDSVLDLLYHFFPAGRYTVDSVQESLKTGNILRVPADFLRYLQTALLDEKLIEVRFDDNEQLYFTKIIDDMKIIATGSQLHTDNDGGSVAHVPGNYLAEMTHLTTLPLEPGIGNFHIRSSNKVVLRMFTKAFAVEFGTSFLAIDKIHDMPVMKFSYPAIGRLLHGEREYRAKVPVDLQLRVVISGKRKQPDIDTSIVDISASGMAFSLMKQDVKHFFVNESRKFILFHDNREILRVNGNVRHITRVRELQSVECICGVQLDLVTKQMSAQIESLVALVQRAHLQALSGLARETGYNLVT